MYADVTASAEHHRYQGIAGCRVTRVPAVEAARLMRYSLSSRHVPGSLLQHESQVSNLRQYLIDVGPVHRHLSRQLQAPAVVALLMTEQ